MAKFTKIRPSFFRVALAFILTIVALSSFVLLRSLTVLTLPTGSYLGSNAPLAKTNFITTTATDYKLKSPPAVINSKIAYPKLDMGSSKRTNSDFNRHDKISFITRELESYKNHRYYVYTNVNLTLPHVRAKVNDPSSTPTWGTDDWKKRFEPYARGELRFYEALEQYQHSDLRTYNISEADFVLVPIPLGPTIYWGEQSDMTSAFHHLLYNEPYFREHPEKHVYITNNERLFRGDILSLIHFKHCCGVTKDLLSSINAGLLVKDFDAHHFRRYVMGHAESDWSTEEVAILTRPLFRHCWSLGYSHETSDRKYKFVEASFDNWKKKGFMFFYHSIREHSQNNSTNFRHALLDNLEKEKLIQPSSIGFEIPYDQWLLDISNSKFCIIIRGDNPSSRSMFVAIRVGCLPVIISDSLPYYQPLFRSLLKYDDFSISVDEKEFLQNPAGSLNKAIMSITELELESKIRGLALLQRMLVLDHPAPLFVPAFVRETVARLEEADPNKLFVEKGKLPSFIPRQKE